MEPIKYAFEIELVSEEAGTCPYIVAAETADEAVIKAKQRAQSDYENKFAFELTKLVKRTTELVL